MGYTFANAFTFGRTVLAGPNLEPVLVPGAFFQPNKQIPFSVFFRLLDSFWFEMREDTKIGTSSVGAGSMQSKNIPPSSDPMALVISFLTHLPWSGFHSVSRQLLKQNPP